MTTPRPTRDAILMDTASLWAQRSTCDRAHVGAVFSRDGRILVTGYNGAPAGMEHCVHDFDLLKTDLSDIPIRKVFRDTGCQIAVHAEANGIAYAARHGIRLDGAELHTTRAMCAMVCAKLIINAGIVRAVWREPHRDMSGLALLMEAGIEVVQYGQ